MARAEAASSRRRRSTSVSPSAQVVGGRAVVAVRRDDEHHAVPLVDEAGHRPGGLGGLVVGVGVEEDDGGHGSIVLDAGDTRRSASTCVTRPARSEGGKPPLRTAHPYGVQWSGEPTDRPGNEEVP